MGLIHATFLIWGIKCLFAPGYLLFFNRESWPDWVKKPLFNCPPCMSSVWGTVWFISTDASSVTSWVTFCVMLCGINYLLVNFLDNITITINDDN